MERAVIVISLILSFIAYLIHLILLLGIRSFAFDKIIDLQCKVTDKYEIVTKFNNTYNSIGRDIKFAIIFDTIFYIVENIVLLYLYFAI